jgi:hypothetical protein
METEFDTERTPVTVTHKGKESTFYARQMGYFEFHELNQSLSSIQDSNKRGVELMKAVAVASLETKDGKPAFTAERITRLPKEIVEPLTNAAMKAQGIDMDRAREQATDEEPSSGNG